MKAFKGKCGLGAAYHMEIYSAAYKVWTLDVCTEHSRMLYKLGDESSGPNPLTMHCYTDEDHGHICQWNDEIAREMNYEGI